ncbi:MAG: diguanylate cyclase [Cupriavidus sp.]|nr:MAG: diguanylate cyclase [Cupriavidus sp.]
MSALSTMEPVCLILLLVLVPLWLAAGVGDWWCHRRAHIECNAGPLESALHAMMLAEIGLPLLLVLFFEVNAALFAVMLAILVIHAVTAWVDVQYASTRREIAPLEQHMHSLLEVLPLTAIALLAMAYWDPFLSLFGVGPEAARFRLEVKREPLPGIAQVAVLAGAAVFGVLPYGEELVRCLRTRRRTGQTRTGDARVRTGT